MTDVTGQRRLTQTTYLAIFLLVLFAAGNGVLRELVTFSLANATASHVILVPFVTIALILRERRDILSSLRPAPRLGTAVVIAGVGIMLVGRLSATGLLSEDRLSLSVAGFVVASVGGFLLFYGTKAVRAASFPLWFLGFTVPFPTGIIATVTAGLKNGSADAVAGLFSLAGTPYIRDGFVFTVPKFVIEIADECSGIRSSIGLLLTMLLASHTFLKSGWAKSVVVLAILPVAILKNGIRIATLTLLAIHVDRGFLDGQLHHDGGIVFFLLGLAMLAPLVFWLCRAELRLERTKSPQAV